MPELSVTVKLRVEHCPVCGMMFAITEDFENRRRNDGQFFRCPSGHKQKYLTAREVEERAKTAERKSAASIEKRRMEVLRVHLEEQAEAKQAQSDTPSPKATGGPLQCPHCDKRYKYRGSLDSHIGYVHGRDF